MRGASVFAFGLLALTGCGRCAADHGRDALEGRDCASACAALVTAGCDRPELAPDQARACEQACADKTRELAPAGCGAERRAYLACVSTARVDCGSARSSAATCIEEKQGVEGCQAEHQAYRRCVAPCLHAGVAHIADKTVVRDGASRRIMVESLRLGCRECGSLAKGAPPGSACQSPKVCAERCCTCPGGRAHFAARVCRDGTCAGEDACSLAMAAGPDPCAD